MAPGRRIRVLRKSKGLTLDYLATASGITASALSLIERNMRKPETLTIQRIAKALNVEIAELTGDVLSEANTDNVELLFARLSNVGEGDMQILKKHILDLPDPRECARLLRRELGLPDGPVDPVAAAAELGISVREDALDGFEAVLLRTGKKDIIVVKSGLSLGRRNFLIAHELGHFYLQDHSNSGYTCQLSAIETYQPNELREQEAHQFAGEFLLPIISCQKKLIRKIPSMALAKKLASQFGVSYQVALQRMVEASSVPLALVVTQDGVRRWFKRSAAFTYFLEVGRPVSEDSLAFQLINRTDQKADNEGFLDGKVPAEAWIKSEDIVRTTKVIEESLPLRSYNTILTLLRLR